MILIGSRALMLRAPQAITRPFGDFDWIATQSEYEDWIQHNAEKVGMTKTYQISPGHMVVEGATMCEFEIIQSGSSAEMLVDLVKDDPNTSETVFGLVPSLNALLAIKDSHKYKKFSSPAGQMMWWKTFADWNMMRQMGAVVGQYQEFVKLREKETYTEKLPSLTNQTKESFFKDDFYVYEHDSIHESQKHLDRPAYHYYAQDNDPIKSDKDKFFACSHEVRLYGALEEISTLALERSVLAHPGVLSLEQAWKMAFSKVLSSITSGFFRKWCYDNGLEILKAYPKDYYEKFQRGLKNGTVVKLVDKNTTCDI